MDLMQLRAMAKINLGLDVVRKREDGYHEVRMIMQTIRMFDRVTVYPEPEIRISSNLHFLPVNENNIAYKAARMMLESQPVRGGVSISLQKRIPVAAGMAGGSADAAAVLKSDDPGRVIDILKGSGFDVYSADEAYRANQ